MANQRGSFASKWGVILATAGSAVGLGNVWRFPYMTGQNGGAAFIITYMVCVLFLGIPCMLSEFIIGRRAAANTARAYTQLANGKAWKWIGYISVLTGFVITGYYVVVSGWCLQYIYASAVGSLSGNAAYVTTYFQQFSTNLWAPVLCTVLMLLFTHFIVVRGVQSGIEKASKYMMPTLFVLLLVIVGCACMLPGAEKGIRFLLYPDFNKLTGDVFLGALGQAFYSLSIGMGCICTYASYYSKQTNLLNSALQVSVVDSLVAVLAGLMIFPAAFSVGIQPDSGPSLVFITLPNVFNHAFGNIPFLGIFVAVLFYALLSLAALTSLISLHEATTAFVAEELKLSRKRGAAIVTAALLVLGTCCSWSLSGMDWLQIGGKSLFDMFDFVTGQVFLPLAGFFTCLFLGWYVPRHVVVEEFTNGSTVWVKMVGVYLFLIRFVCPLGILLIFLHQLGWLPGA